MSKKGVVSPIEVSQQSARTIADFIAHVFVPRLSSHLKPEFRTALKSFGSKLQKASRRRGGSDPVRLWTLTDPEVSAGFRFLALFLSPAFEASTDRTIAEAREPAISLLTELMGQRRPGRPRLKATEAEALIRKYWEAPSALRGEIVGGSQLKLARERVDKIDASIEYVREKDPENSRVVEATVGRDGLRNLVASLLDRVEDLPEYPS